MEKRITTLFLDIGGVLLTNGWERLWRALNKLAPRYSFVPGGDTHQILPHTSNDRRVVSNLRQSRRLEIA